MLGFGIVIICLLLLRLIFAVVYVGKQLDKILYIKEAEHGDKIITYKE